MSRHVISSHNTTLVSHNTVPPCHISHMISCHVTSCHVTMCRSPDREPYTSHCPVQHYWHEQGGVHQVFPAQTHSRGEVRQLFLWSLFYSLLRTSFFTSCIRTSGLSCLPSHHSSSCLPSIAIFLSSFFCFECPLDLSSLYTRWMSAV